MHMLNNLGSVPGRPIMHGSVWVDFCLTELFPVKLYFYVCLKPAAAHVTQTVGTLCAIPRTVNEAIAETVEQMTCKYLQ